MAALSHQGARVSPGALVAVQANAQHNTGWYQWRDATIVEPLWVTSTANHISFAGPGLVCMQQLPGGTGKRAPSSGAAVAVRCVSPCSRQ